jgi:hypothetical protein
MMGWWRPERLRALYAEWLPALKPRSAEWRRRHASINADEVTRPRKIMGKRALWHEPQTI